jgi:chromatin remodeling complex protein RSC6
MSKNDDKYSQVYVVTDEAANLFGIKEPITFNQLIKTVFHYMDVNKLQDPSNKNRYIPDKNLQQLFDIREYDVINYINCHKLLYKLFRIA